jgi:hypothetical protein
LDFRVYPERQLPWRAPLSGENSEPQDRHLPRKHALPAQIDAKNIPYHQHPRQRRFSEVLMYRLCARAFATHHDLVPQGIGVVPEPAEAILKSPNTKSSTTNPDYLRFRETPSPLPILLHNKKFSRAWPNSGNFGIEFSDVSDPGSNKRRNQGKLFLFARI